MRFTLVKSFEFYVHGSLLDNANIVHFRIKVHKLVNYFQLYPLEELRFGRSRMASMRLAD